MKRIGFVASAIYIVAFLLFLAGIILIILGFAGSSGSIYYGLSCIVACPLVWGYAYIVEAAIKYLDS